MIAKHRFFLTEDKSEVVKEDDARAHSLLVGKGCELPDVIAAQYDFPSDAEADEAIETDIVAQPQTDSVIADTTREQSNGATGGEMHTTPVPPVRETPVDEPANTRRKTS